ncbi:MAG: hypothetical protein ABI343_18830, partial [Burkholderiaceae bacterium]
MNCLHRVRKFVACGCLALSALAGSALAHKGSDAYLDVQEADAPVSPTSVATPSARKLHFTLAVAIKDLDLLLPMDANADGKVTWGEARAAMPAVLALANEAANLEAPRAGGTVAGQPGCHLQWQLDGMDRRGD